MNEAASLPSASSGEWWWERTDPFRSGGAGDLAKLFKNETVKQPGILAKGAPSTAATLMAREVLQNSWDAASELQGELAKRGLEAPKFDISFHFDEVTGTERSEMFQAMNVGGLASHFHEACAASGVGALGMARTTVLDHFDDPEQVVRILKITESGTTGMYGRFEGAKSKMFLALISVGYTVKAAGSGGSYGYGKAGLIAGSATRTVFAYSCFEPREDDVEGGEPVTRRFLGMTYWGQHDAAGKSFTGFGRLGQSTSNGVAPYTNAMADEMATRLGITRRDHNDPTQLGTTFLLLDPVVQPEDLVNAIERNWWPAIAERRFMPMTTVRREDGSILRLPPKPLRNPHIAPFVRAYEVATVPQDNDVPHEFKASLEKLPAALGGSKVGQIGIVADLGGWSFDNSQVESEDDSSVGHTSLIALTRGPRMIVEYLQPHGTKGRAPYVRGVFVADDDVDDLLRQTEPRAHDAWVTTSSNLEDGIDERAPKIATHVLREIGRETKRFQQRLRPPLPDPTDVKLTTLAKLFRRIARGDSGIIVPPSGDRDVSIRTSIDTKLADSGRVKAKGNIKISLADSYTKSDVARARIKISYRFVENDKAGTPADLILSGECIDVPADGEGYREIFLTRSYQRIEFETEPYSPDWSGRLSIVVTDLVEVAQ
jgi:hypothetical protein